MKNLRYGSRGAKVKKLQLLLVELGYAITIDGLFGNQTENVVKDFQTKNNLQVDGIVGKNTLDRIELRLEESKASEDLEEFKLGGVKMTEQDIVQVANSLDVEVAAVKAVYEVESRGAGFLSDKRPKILFEGHIFWRQLKAFGIDPDKHTMGNEDILFSKWTRKHYKGGAKEYLRLDRAKEIHETAALAAASWGTFQIMGFNYKLCGFSDVKSYVKSQYISEGEHLKAFGNFILSVHLVRHLRSKNWKQFARGYNGSSYKLNKYDEKLEAAYAKYAT